jgi:2-dehydropantoate 2-reductase
LTSAVRRIDAGNIVLERLRGMGIAMGHPLALPIVNALNQAGLNARPYENAQSMKWSKMLTNLLANSTSAILDMTPVEIFAHPKLYELEVRQIREALNVMDGLGLPVINLPGTPIRLLAFIMRNLPDRFSQPIAKSALGRGRGGKMPSFHIDLYAGKTKSEVDYLNGAVVRYAQQLGIEVPVNKVLNETLLSLLSGTQSIEDFAKQPGKLLALLNINYE